MNLNIPHLIKKEHVARKSLKDLQRVNTILLDHIISKNPELDLLVAAQSSEEEQLQAANAAATTPSDAQINAALERNRLRNCQAKFGMMLKMKNSISAPAIPSVDRHNQRPEELQNSNQEPVSSRDELSHKQDPSQDHERNHHLRMHSLAQIDDLKMDKKYLEHELSISFPTSLSSISLPGTTTGEKTDMTDIQIQIESAHLAAKDAFESRVTLERKTVDMYTNLETMKPKSSSLVPSQKTLHVAFASAKNDKAAGGLNWELLEPSEFLKQHLPASQITVRSHTASAVHKKSQHGKKGLPLAAIPRQNSTPSLLPSADGQRDTDLTRNNSVASVAKKRHHQQHHGHSHLLHKSASTSSTLQVAKTFSTLRKNGSNSNEGNESDDDSHNEDALSLGDGDTSMSKLRTINQIIAKAQDYSSPSRESSPLQLSGGNGKHTRPKTAPFPHVSASNTPTSGGGNMSDAHNEANNCEDEQNHDDKSEDTVEVPASPSHDDLVRQHLDETKRKMESAMRDGEPRSSPSPRSDLKKQRHRVKAAVFQAIDKDGNGHVSLKELLEICFHYATKYQIGEMLTLTEVGNVRLYLEGEYGGGASTPGGCRGDANTSAENRRELLEIFRVFGKNGDGGVSQMELMEALRVDDDDVMARVMTEQATSRGSGTWVDAISSSGITKDGVERLYDEFDANRNATLDFDEFVALLRMLYGPKSNVYFR
ncbi:Ribosomal RNA processing protein 1 b, partial [Globisporangium splendens]